MSPLISSLGQSFAVGTTFPKIVTDGLVLYLDAGQQNSYSGSRTIWRDLSGNGNNGTLTNGPTYSSTNGGSIVFDGVNDYVITSNNVNISGDFSATLSVWVKFIELSTGYRCVCMFGATGTMQGFSLFSNIVAYGSGSVAIGFYGIQNAYVQSVLTTNTWYNLVATKIPGAVSSSNTKLYINGALQTLTFATSSIPNATNTVAYIGSDPVNEVSNNMNISSFSIYNRALTASEIQQNFNALRGRFGI